MPPQVAAMEMRNRDFSRRHADSQLPPYFSKIILQWLEYTKIIPRLSPHGVLNVTARWRSRSGHLAKPPARHRCTGARVSLVCGARCWSLSCPCCFAVAACRSPLRVRPSASYADPSSPPAMRALQRLIAHRTAAAASAAAATRAVPAATIVGTAAAQRCRSGLALGSRLQPASHRQQTHRSFRSSAPLAAPAPPSKMPTKNMVARYEKFGPVDTVVKYVRKQARADVTTPRRARFPPC